MGGPGGFGAEGVDSVGRSGCDFQWNPEDPIEYDLNGGELMTKFVLQLLAMVFMLCDHLCATIMSEYIWLHWIGRLAYPIFAFMLVEGYFHTSNFKKYAKRIFLFAILAEIPLNLCTAGGFIYPFHQNVMWTFLISLFVMKAMDKILAMKGKPDASPVAVTTGNIGKALLCVVVGLLGYGLCFITFVDYYGYGLLMVLVFFFSRKIRDWKIPQWMVMVLQLAAMFYINVMMIRGEIRYFDIFGAEIGITIQGLALFALPLIWLYNGKQGYHSKAWQYFCYAFYPVHMLILGLMWMYL